jgi:hypothetical protein
MAPKEKPPFAMQGGLVNFPKYMLTHNCDLKTRDVIRFHKEQEDAMKTAAEAAKLGLDPPSPKFEQSPKAQRDFPEPSWGAPRLREQGGASGGAWAGSTMPLGRGMRTSNPFRMG